MLLVIVSSVVVLLLLWLLHVVIIQPFLNLREMRRQGIPGPPFRPLLGQMPEMRKLGNRRKVDPEFASATSPMPHCHELIQKYGPLVSICFGPLPALIAVDPAAIRAIYVSNNLEFEKPWMMRKLFPLLGRGLLTSNRATWAAHRRLVNPAFKPGEIMKMYPGILQRAIAATKALHRDASSAASAKKHHSKLAALEGGCSPSETRPQRDATWQEEEGGAGKLVRMDTWVAALMLQLLGHSVFGADLGGSHQQEVVREGDGDALRPADANRRRGGEEERQSEADRLVTAYAEWFESTRFSFSLLDVLPGSSFLPLPQTIKRVRSEAIVRSCAQRLIEERKRRREEERREEENSEEKKREAEETRQNEDQEEETEARDETEAEFRGLADRGLSISGSNGQQCGLSRKDQEDWAKVQTEKQEEKEAVLGSREHPRDLLDVLLSASEVEDSAAEAEPTAKAAAEAGAAAAGAKGAAAAAATHHSKNAPAASLSNEELIDQCMTFLTAGHETTAISISWTLLALAQHKEWQRAVREEARGVLLGQGSTGEERAAGLVMEERQDGKIPHSYKERQDEGMQQSRAEIMQHPVVGEGGENRRLQSSVSAESRADEDESGAQLIRTDTDAVSDSSSGGSIVTDDSKDSEVDSGASADSSPAPTETLRKDMRLQDDVLVLQETRHLWSEIGSANSLLQGPLTQDLLQRSFATEKLQQLRTMTMVINESMRLFSPVYFVARYNHRAVRISESTVLPGGVHVALPIGLLHRRKELWGDDAEEFKPQRFGPGGHVPAGAFIPFSLGPRFCVGQNLAMAEVKTIVALLVLHFELEVAPSYQFHPELGFNTRNKNGVPLVLKPLCV